MTDAMTVNRERIEEVRLIRDSAKVISNTSDFKRIRELRFKTPGFDRSVYKTMADMGWIGLIVPEDRGGAGLGNLEFCALAEELGAALVPEPFILAAMTATLLDGEALAHSVSGEQITLLAWQEAANSLDSISATTFHKKRLNGSKVFVPMATGADNFLVSCPEGMVLVAADAPGVRIDIHLTQDGGHYGTVHLENAVGNLMGGDLSKLFNRASLATAAYLLGVIETSMSLTIDYLKARHQFGNAIGTFQSLQHRAVDLTVQRALARASIESAAMLLDEGASPSIADAAVSRAKVRATDTAMFVTRQAVQMHGGIGYTDEADIGLFLRKAMVLASTYGSAQLHRDRYARLALDTEL
jgi:alkylation response protein AidB-like acyl-CoA dehydrogenase